LSYISSSQLLNNMNKINFAIASIYSFSVEFIHNGDNSPSWITISKLKSENAFCDDNFKDIIEQLGEQEGISWHCQKGKENTYRISPGIDGFVIANLLANALEEITSNQSVLKIIEYNCGSHRQKVESFEKDILLSYLNLESEDQQ
jgi:hypothetical protein